MDQYQSLLDEIAQSQHREAVLGQAQSMVSWSTSVLIFGLCLFVILRQPCIMQWTTRHVSARLGKWLPTIILYLAVTIAAVLMIWGFVEVEF